MSKLEKSRIVRAELNDDCAMTYNTKIEWQQAHAEAQEKVRNVVDEESGQLITNKSELLVLKASYQNGLTFMHGAAWCRDIKRVAISIAIYQICKILQYLFA